MYIPLIKSNKAKSNFGTPQITNHKSQIINHKSCDYKGKLKVIFELDRVMSILLSKLINIINNIFIY